MFIIWHRQYDWQEKTSLGMGIQLKINMMLFADSTCGQISCPSSFTYKLHSWKMHESYCTFAYIIGWKSRQISRNKQGLTKTYWLHSHYNDENNNSCKSFFLLRLLNLYVVLFCPEIQFYRLAASAFQIIFI